MNGSGEVIRDAALPPGPLAVLPVEVVVTHAGAPEIVDGRSPIVTVVDAEAESQPFTLTK